VESLRDPKATEGVIGESILLERLGSGEIGEVGRAFNSVQSTFAGVAKDHAELLRKGIGEIFVKLARRNQSLVERQIELLDELESAEKDLDVLENLFKLDHLATRVRRNAESLLVLAGSEPSRRWSDPVPLDELLQGAMSEIEDYRRIRVASGSAGNTVEVVGAASLDVAHLIAELLDNAVRFSPPDTAVEVLVRRREETCMVYVSDTGMGMTDEQLEEANELLANPPEPGLDLSRTLGLYVAGLRRHRRLRVAATRARRGRPRARVAARGGRRHERPRRSRGSAGATCRRRERRAPLERRGSVRGGGASPARAGDSRAPACRARPGRGDGRADARRRSLDADARRAEAPALELPEAARRGPGVRDAGTRRRRGAGVVNGRSGDAREFGWLVVRFVESTPGVSDALVLSADGLPMAVSPGLAPDLADRLAAVAAGLVGLANGAAVPFRAGRVTQVVVELENAFIFVTGVSEGSSLAVLAQADCDPGLVAYEMGALVHRAASMLTPALRTELHASLSR